VTHLDTESKRVDVDEENVSEALLTSEYTSLNGSTPSNGLVWVDALGGFLSVEVLLEQLLNLGDTRGTTDEYDVVNVLLLDAGILENLLNGLHRLAEQVGVELFELCAGERLGKVLSVKEALNFNLGGHLARKRTLGTLNFALQLTDAALVARSVESLLLAELLENVLADTVVEVLSTQVRVTGSCEYLEYTVLDGKERDIEGSSSEVEDEDVALASGLLVETVGDGGGGRLVDDSEDIEAGNGAGVLGGLSLRVVEVGRDGDDCKQMCNVSVRGLEGPEL